MAKKVSAANARAHFSELVASVAYGNERYIIEHCGKPLAALVSLEDLAALQETAVRPRGALALVGAWDEMEDQELDALVSEMNDRDPSCRTGARHGSSDLTRSLTQCTSSTRTS